MAAVTLDTIVPPTSAPFVGRQHELASIEDCLRAALSGRPGVVVVEGEAGIGKSRLTREAVAFAERLGFQSCPGRFVDSRAVPFLPLVATLLPQLERAGILAMTNHAADAATLKRLLATGEALPDIHAEGRQLYPALSRLVAALASRRPLVLAFDDLHWAEPDAIDLLLHLALGVVDAANSRLPLVLVLITRAPESGSPLGAMLARLRREPAVNYIRLAGLRELETNEFVRGSTSVPCTPALLHLLQDATRGNPLFVAEALGHLAGRGALREVDGHLANTGNLRQIPLPKELAVAIEAKAAALEPAAAAALSAAAIVGDSFEAGPVARLAGLPVAEALSLFDAAIRRGFLFEEGTGYRFAHPSFREVFRHRLPPGERRKLHFEAGRQLLETSPSSAIEIAQHFLDAGPLVEPLERGRRAAMAGDRAIEMTAYAEAARFYNEALAIEPYIASIPRAHSAHLALRCGYALYRNTDRAASLERYRHACELFREAGDLAGWGEALTGATRGHFAYGALRVGEPLDSGPIDEYLAVAREKAPLESGLLMCQWSEALHNARDPGARRWAEDALEIASRLDDDFLSMRANFTLGRACQRDLDPAAALAAHRRALEFARRIDDPWWVCQGLQNQPQALIALGRIDEAETVARETLAVAAEVHDWAIQTAGLSSLTAIAVLRGRFDEAERLAVDAQKHFRRSRWSYMPAIVYPALAYARTLRGQWPEALDALDMLEAVIPASCWAQRHALFAAAGDVSTVRIELEAHPGRAFWKGAPDMFVLNSVTPRIDLADELRLPALAQHPRDILQQAATLGNKVTFGPGYLVQRLLAVSAWLANDRATAREHFDAAIRDGQVAGARPELARSHLGLATMLLEDEDPTAAAPHLRTALSLCEELGMTPCAERARSLADRHSITVPPVAGLEDGGIAALPREILFALASGRRPADLADQLLLSERTVTSTLEELRRTAGVTDEVSARQFLRSRGLAPAEDARATDVASARPGPLRVLMFCDIVESTRQNYALGDARWAVLLDRHDTIVAECVHRWSGTVHKKLGDGVFSSFASAAAAVECALDIQSRFPIFHPEEPGVGVVVRVGLSAGEPVAAGDDLIGLSVVEARRISDLAEHGGVLVSETVRLLASNAIGLAFVDRGRFALKGFNDLARLYQVRPKP